MKSNLRNLVLMPLMVLSMTASIWAEEITLPITGYAIINNESGESRILANIPIPQGTTDSTLAFAEINFAIIPQLAGDSILRVNCHAVTTQWESVNVNWTTPWQNPGGDFDSDELTMFTSSSGDNQIAIFDLTDGVKSWLGGIRTNNGLIFVIPAYLDSRFDVGQLPDQLPGVFGTIRFVTR